MTHDVGDEHRDPFRVDRDIVAEVAAELGAGDVTGTDRHLVEDHIGDRQEAALERASVAELSLEPVDVPSVLLAAPAQLESAFDQCL